MLMRREALEQVGALDEGYWLYMEDLDWCYRFCQAGWPVLYRPAVDRHPRQGWHGRERHRRRRLNYAFHRGMWLFYRKFQAAGAPRPGSLLVYLGIGVKLAASLATGLVARAGRRG